jgi:hypothetical protein
MTKIIKSDEEAQKVYESGESGIFVEIDQDHPANAYITIYDGKAYEGAKLIRKELQALIEYCVSILQRLPDGIGYLVWEVREKPYDGKRNHNFYYHCSCYKNFMQSLPNYSYRVAEDISPQEAKDDLWICDWCDKLLIDEPGEKYA